MKNLLTLIILALFFNIFAGCAPKTPDEFDNARAMYEYGSRLFNEKRYTEAVDFFETLKNKYPSSPYITDAEFKLAESYFQKRDYIEAVYAFQNFKYLHPTNEKSALATFRIAQSYFEQIPGSIDRDQTNTVNAITWLRDLVASYPGFEKIDEAKEMLQKCKRMLAERELYVANFYFKNESYKAAVGRLESLKKEYDFRDLRQEAVYKLAYSYHKLNDKDKTLENINELLGMEPDAKYQEKADRLIKKIRKKEKN
jgi:outer membrane protein assembly factor BamD